MVLRSVGYTGSAVEGVPFDAKSGTIPNENGRVLEKNKTGGGNVYVVGWIKRGPSGIIGINRACSFNTVEKVLGDMEGHSLSNKQGSRGLEPLLASRKIRVVGIYEWKKIDNFQRALGCKVLKPREKLTRIGQMLDVAFTD